MTTAARSSPVDDLLLRIRAEYTEMPGLRVTLEQAQRLWGLDAPTCRQALDCLVDVKFLTQTASGQYMRLTEGAHRPNLQMARAALGSRANDPRVDRRTS